MPPPNCGHQLRSTAPSTLLSIALAASLTLALGLSAFAEKALAKNTIPLPRPRPLARKLIPKAASAARPPATISAASVARAAAPAAIAATSSTPQVDMDALENVIELIRKHKPDDASAIEVTISDPVAKKLAEWLILRSDNNNATVERYRAFLSANPSWPSQIFLRKRLEAALWDDRREDSVAWSWFENESPLTAKGRFALAKAMLARGDRANAERLVREAWRNDPMSEDTENTALELFGALLTAGDNKARMDLFLYTTENESAAMRAAQRRAM